MPVTTLSAAEVAGLVEDYQSGANIYAPATSHARHPPPPSTATGVTTSLSDEVGQRLSS
jgi:hypothetical protein